MKSSWSNVGKLSLAWHYDLEPGFTVSTPVAAEGKLFVTTGHSRIRAFDARHRQAAVGIRREDARDRDNPRLHMSWGNKGIAYLNGRVFVATTDGRVIALDASSGKPVWEQRQFELTELRNSNGAPRVFDGKVIIGHGGADISPIRGYVTAYDAMTGKQLWRFYTVPGDPSKPAENKAEEVMRPTWKGDWFGKGGGGTAWNAFSYDAELDLIYIGVGNGFPYNQQLRSPGGGDNLFLASIVAVKADTGEYVWHYQVCPAEQWDCTAVQDMTIATLDDRRQAAQGRHASAEERILLRARCGNRRIHLGREDREGHVGGADRCRTRDVRSRTRAFAIRTSRICSKCGRGRKARTAGCRKHSVREPGSSISRSWNWAR